MHYTVGTPAPYQQLYYAAPAHAKKQEEAEQQNIYVAQAEPFVQETIDIKKGLGIKVANKGCHCLDCWALEFAFFLLVAGTIPLVLVDIALIAIPIVIYFLRLIVLCCTDTSKFLSKLNLDINPYEHTDTL